MASVARDDAGPADGEVHQLLDAMFAHHAPTDTPRPRDFPDAFVVDVLVTPDSFE